MSGFERRLQEQVYESSAQLRIPIPKCVFGQKEDCHGAGAGGGCAVALCVGGSARGNNWFSGAPRFLGHPINYNFKVAVVLIDVGCRFESIGETAEIVDANVIVDKRLHAFDSWIVEQLLGSQNRFRADETSEINFTYHQQSPPRVLADRA